MHPSSTYPTRQNHLSIKPIQLNKLHHHPNNLVLAQIHTGVLHPQGNQLINDAPQSRDQHTDTSPAAETQPPINHQSAALSI